MTVWQKHLEVVGAEIFQTYRKRLMLPGIAFEIRRDYPGLSMLDVLVRVHAGRQIIQAGDDFRALQAIRSGHWQRLRQDRGQRQVADRGRNDRVSRLMVAFGGCLFAGFCVLSLSSTVPEGHGLIAGTGLGVVAALLWWRHYRDGGGNGDLSSGIGTRFS